MYASDYFAHLIEWKKVQLISSGTVFSALKILDAGLWLIGGFRFPQALTSFSNSIELLLKGELERYDPALIDGKKALSILQIRELISKGKNNKEIVIDLERTITTKEAIKRIGYIHEFESLTTMWRDQLYQLVERRNIIVHYGPNPANEGQYAADIISIAIPFLNDFLQISNGISLKELVSLEVHEEIEVAQKVYRKLQEENQPPLDYILKSLAYKVRGTLTEWPNSEEDDGGNLRLQEEIFLAREMERSLWSDWADGDWVEEFCKICGCARMFVKVRPYTQPTRGLIPLAVRCPRCSLEISEADKYLAEFHITLSEDVIEDYFLNNFYPDDWDEPSDQ